MGEGQRLGEPGGARSAARAGPVRRGTGPGLGQQPEQDRSGEGQGLGPGQQPGQE